MLRQKNLNIGKLKAKVKRVSSYSLELIIKFLISEIFISNMQTKSYLGILLASNSLNLSFQDNKQKQENGLGFISQPDLGEGSLAQFKLNKNPKPHFMM